MNRRDFIKVAVPSAALATWTVNCKYEEKEHDPKGEKGEVGETGCKRWDYRVYCYERGQGEWTFSQNIRGSFAPEREYMTFEEEEWRPYAGWMDQGKLHFATLEDAQDFVDMHVRAKDDVDLIDSIYDIYYVSRELPVYDDAENMVKEGRETEIKIAHFWFNGDTGRQLSWVESKPYTNWSKVECS
jgi:hypothetical protein